MYWCRRITSICDTPLIVDADTGWGHAFNVARTKKSFRSGAAGLHIEDQVAAKDVDIDQIRVSIYWRNVW